MSRVHHSIPNPFYDILIWNQPNEGYFIGQPTLEMHNVSFLGLIYRL